MRQTRLMTWLFLVLSLAFFCTRDFRVAAEEPLVSLLPHPWNGEFRAAETARLYGDIYRGPDRSAWRLYLLDFGVGRILERLYTLERYVSPEQLRRMALDAEAQGDVNMMAFAALHLPKNEMRADILRLANKAVSLNPSLTWLLYHTVARYQTAPISDELRAAVQKLQAWDPENSVPYILLAQMIRANRVKTASLSWDDRPKIVAAIEQELEWFKTMEKAFDRKRYDGYSLRRFELEKKVMLQHGWTHPVVFALLLEPTVPAWAPVRDYASILVGKIGRGAETDGRLEKALACYHKVVRFGGRMRLQARHSWNEHDGVMLQRFAYMRLAVALKDAGREQEAAEAQFAFQQAARDLERQHTARDAYTGSHSWSAFFTNLAAGLVWVFLVLAVVCVAYVNLKRWIRKEKTGLLYRFLTSAESYSAVLLFVACFGLYLAYQPYTQNFRKYLTGNPSADSLEQIVVSSSPALAGLRLAGSLPLGTPFGIYILYALSGLALLALISMTARRLATGKSRQRADSASAR